MASFSSDGVNIAYELWGEGLPVLLIHGFASTGRINWVDTHWVRVINDAGFAAITIDNRGHGASEKLYDPGQYGAPLMAEDARRLIGHLGHQRAAVMGYSMGARITAFLTIAHPQLVSRVVFAGLAANMIRGVPEQEEIAQALEARERNEVSGAGPMAFRLFAEQTHSDLKALAACMRSSRQKIAVDELRTISCPVLVVAGGEDDIAGPVAPLVEAIPGAHGLTLAGRNHMSAVGDKTYKRAVLEFLKETWEAPKATAIDPSDQRR